MRKLKAWPPNCAASVNEQEHSMSTGICSDTGQLPKGSPVWRTILLRKSSKARQPRHTNPSSNNPQREKVKVPGVHKVWEMMKSCAENIVSNIIAQFCPAVSANRQLSIKFKTTDSASGGHIMKWWFVIHGVEDLLNELQDKWENIAVQTSWKLEECFMLRALYRLPNNMLSTLGHSSLLSRMYLHFPPNICLSPVTMPQLSSQASQMPTSRCQCTVTPLTMEPPATMFPPFWGNIRELLPLHGELKLSQV